MKQNVSALPTSQGIAIQPYPNMKTKVITNATAVHCVAVDLSWTPFMATKTAIAAVQATVDQKRIGRRPKRSNVHMSGQVPSQNAVFMTAARSYKMITSSYNRAANAHDPIQRSAFQFQRR